MGIEDFLWAGAVGGIASVVGEILLKERLAARRKEHRKKHYAPFIVMFAVFLILWRLYPNKNIYNTAIAFAVCALVVAFLRSDLIPTMVVGGSLDPYLAMACFRSLRSHLFRKRAQRKRLEAKPIKMESK